MRSTFRLLHPFNQGLSYLFSYDFNVFHKNPWCHKLPDFPLVARAIDVAKRVHVQIGALVFEYSMRDFFEPQTEAGVECVVASSRWLESPRF